MAYDKIVDSTVLDGYFSDIADAIRSKDGTQNTYTPAQMPQAIEAIPSGGTVSTPRKDVNFIDYDGTIVESYTADEFLSLFHMPENPSHDGLTAQGWNWSIFEAQDYVSKYGGLDIGQMYTTTSGDTEIDIELHDGILDPVLHAGPCEIDWGDGTTDVATAYTTTQHIYQAEGSYTIKLTPTSNELRLSANSGSGGVLEKANYGDDNENNPYRGLIKAVRLGDNIDLTYMSTFKKCVNLRTITIPANTAMGSIGQETFYNCFSLVSVTIPSTVTSIGSYAFYTCQAAESLSIPATVTSIGDVAFGSMYSLQSIALPENATSGGAQLCHSCFSLKKAILANNANYVKTHCFYANQSLEELLLPNDTTAIPNNFLYNAPSLRSLTIPASVTSIANGAFFGCYGLKELHMLPDTPPTLTTSSWSPAIQIAADCIIYVPAGTLNDYQTATNWTTFASQMQEE